MNFKKFFRTLFLWWLLLLHNYSVTGSLKNVLKINLPLLWGTFLCFCIGPLHFLVTFSQVNWRLAHNFKNDVLLFSYSYSLITLSKQIFHLNEYLFGYNFQHIMFAFYILYFSGWAKTRCFRVFYSLFTFKQAFWQLQQLTKRNELKSAATDIRYFARRKFSRSLVHNNFELDMTSSFQVRIHILSRKVGYLFWAWMKSHERQ